MKSRTGRGLLSSALAAISLVAISTVTPASAGSLKDGPTPPPSPFEWSVNFGVMSDYVFRGYSQSAGDPVAQGGVDLTYKLFYAGVWASGIDFGTGSGTSTEIDLYAGIKPNYGPVTFDFGVIYYIYPGANDAGAELDYVELKAGASTTIDKFSFGGTAFYSPEYTGEVGAAWTLERTAGYELPSYYGITPSLSATVGTTLFDATGLDDYVYWNAGIAFAAGKVALDLRYWDTDVDSAVCSAKVFGCDERFVATVKVALP
jgi:uncharacterized protein (TIGR02001 family)